ncbi:RHS repeat-associated core domain-containing protein [Pseudomonas fluorescens]|uniref:RHS repeat-associated core domain-containing protein n=1 Tax=Pseudomonas fluorescens TaxID=294 RepID=A0A5E7CCE0_PSEFL|nr:RHS repeat-associated core domain-containing protein [Pseudomonas fluorescens]VVO02509.1 hypothetical protein PS723_02755 [Pseudomonas fluorescens]
MSTSPRETVLCRYHHDALDRLADCTLFEEPGIQRFYCESRLATEIQGPVQCSIFQHDDQLLAQQQSQGGRIDTHLLATDQQRSVLNALDATRPHPLTYAPYGHRPQENGLLSLLGFNGERPDPITGHYHLGNGYRQFNPVLMRFNSPDSWSPFGKGGLNAYGYCAGDPVNQSDPTGHFSVFGILKLASSGALLTGIAGSVASKFIKDEDIANPLRITSIALLGVSAVALGLAAMGPRIMAKFNARPAQINARRAMDSRRSVNTPPEAFEMQPSTRPRSQTTQNPANHTPASQGNFENTRHLQGDAQPGARVPGPQSNANENAALNPNLKELRQS